MTLPLFRTQQPVNLFQVIAKCNSVDSTSSTVDVHHAHGNSKQLNGMLLSTTTRAPSPGSSNSSGSHHSRSSITNNNHNNTSSSSQAASADESIAWRTKEPSSIFAAPSRQMQHDDPREGMWMIQRCNAFDEDDSDEDDDSLVSEEDEEYR